MALLCYHASHEQFPPSQLLKLVVLAEQAGFTGLHSSDHFHPWSASQGQSGFSFAWIGAALQATSLPFSMVCAPGQRYHPAIVAQAIATLAEMFPGRYCVELGSGEAMNEAITGQQWPDKKIRNARLLESAHVIRRLLKGEKVSFEGLVTVKDAKLYTLPGERPLLLGAAVTEETALWLGSWADGLLTTGDPDMKDTEKKIRAFRENGGEHKPVHVQYSFSYARDRKTAVDEVWDQWKTHVAADGRWADIATVEEFDAIGRHVTREEVVKENPVFTSIDELMDQVRTIEEMGASRIILHNLNRQQEAFIEDFGKAL